MLQVHCFCESTVQIPLDSEIDIDVITTVFDDIIKGSFLSVVCPNCKKLLKPELQLHIFSKLRNIDLIFLPEIQRGEYYRGVLKDLLQPPSELLIGYSELYERAKIITDKLDPIVVEIIKYWILVKATEDNHKKALIVSYSSLEEKGNDKKLIFTISGLKQDMLGQLPIDIQVYEQLLTQKKEKIAHSPFLMMFSSPYKSVRALEIHF